MRILFDADPAGGGGVTPPAEPSATPPAEPAKPPTPPAPNPLAADLAAARSKLAELEAKEAERASATQAEEEKKLAAKGEFDKLLKQRDDQLAAEKKATQAAVERSKTYAMNSQIALALAKHDLYEGSAEDLSKLWRDDFETVADGEGWTVRAKDGRPVADVITERLATPRYANHVKATARSGSGGGNGNVPAPTQNGNDAKAPTNYEEYQRQVLQIDDPNRAPFLGLSGRRTAK